MSVDNATLTFTSDNWSTPQAVKVTAADRTHDTADDCGHAHSQRVRRRRVRGRVGRAGSDGDRRRHSLMLVLSTTTVEVMEGAETGATYTVRLGTEPSATTTVT